MPTIYQSVSLEAEECIVCGCWFAMSTEMQKNRRNDGQNFYCPNGHGMSYGKGEVVRLREQLEIRERELRQSKCETLNERNMREATEKSLLSIRNRVKHGVCPCCKRTVKQLAQHMKTKHPDFKP